MPEPKATAEQFRVGDDIRDLGHQLDGWTPAAVEVDGQSMPSIEAALETLPNRFSGKVALYHNSWVIPDDFKPSFVIELKYVDGRLSDVQWGILPG